MFTKASRDKLVENYNYLLKHSQEPLTTFLDYLRHSYVIDNIILLLIGSMHKNDTKELLEKCHPLGMFNSISALCVATNPEDLYNLVLIDSPVAPYFKSCITAQDFDEVNIEIIRNTLYKKYYEHFYEFCKTLGEPTKSVMGRIIKFESDRRIITLTVNSLDTDLSEDNRLRMYPTTGLLYPYYTAPLANAKDIDEVKTLINSSGTYPFFSTYDGSDKSLENVFFEHEVKLNRETFMSQFQYGLFYSYIKLMEHETRNVTWIAECIAQRQKAKINNYIPIFDS